MLDTLRATRAYVKIRDARSELLKEFEAKDNELKAKLELIENAMLEHLHEAGASSVKTSEGTFYKREEMTPTGSDWEAFYAWVRENDAFDFLERRIGKRAVKEYMDAHQGAVPPGVSVFRQYRVGVRRSNEGKQE